VLYQVYVRSFCDTDGDGYGDLAGVRAHLDHLSSLGVDGIWLSPTMPSPDTDWGYDVSDYLDVHPELGTLADLDALVADAAAAGMRVLLDLVPNHTSDRHPWFVEARSDPGSARRAYYVWADPSPDGGPPNNWRNMTGEPAWTLDPASGQYYLHNYLPTQPDLNWWHPAVHDEFERILSFWLDRGVAGFRIDVAHGIYKDAELRDDPPPPASTGSERPRRLRQVYSANRPETHALYRTWRRLADSYDPARLLLGETFVSDVADLARFYGDDDELHLAFNFRFALSSFDPAELSGVLAATLAALPEGACPTWTASNHDIGRFPSRWCDDDPLRTRAALTVLLSLPGTVVLYYGDELGQVDVSVPDALQRDPMTWHGRGGAANRDRARTPMPWRRGEGGGFCPPGVEPWLPLGPMASTVEDQEVDPDSALALTRRLVALRRAHHRGRVLPYRLLEQTGGLWRYAVGPLEVLANLADTPQHTVAPRRLLFSSHTARRPGGDPADQAGGPDPGAAGEGAHTVAGEGPGAASSPITLGAWEVVVASAG